MTITFIPWSAKSLSFEKSIRRWAGFNRAEGSSRIRTEGFFKRAPEREIKNLSSPPQFLVSVFPVMPLFHWERIFSASSLSKSFTPSDRFSITVIESERMGRWWTQTMPSLMASEGWRILASFPFIKKEPEFGRRSPQRIFIRLDFRLRFRQESY